MGGGVWGWGNPQEVLTLKWGISGALLYHFEGVGGGSGGPSPGNFENVTKNEN